MAENRRSDILFAAAVVVFLALAWHIRDVLLLIYVAALFAVIIGPAMTFLQRQQIGKWHPSRGIAMLAIILSVGIVLTLLIVFLAPPIIHDLQSFSAEIPRRTQNLYERLQRMPFGKNIDISSLQRYATDAVGGAFGLFAGIAGGVFGFISWLILTIYFILDGERAFNWGLSLIKRSQRDRIRTTLQRAEGRVSMWLLGQGILMVLLGTASAITFRLLHVRYALALGAFAGLANIVPIVGPIAAAVLATSVAAFDSWNKAAGVILFYVIYQQIENAFLTPKIMKSTVDLPALAVIIALAIGGKLAGVVGALVAVPTAALLGVIIDEYLVKRSPLPDTTDK
jgi:predicted PurR-regulated permease PerM